MMITNFVSLTKTTSIARAKHFEMLKNIFVQKLGFKNCCFFDSPQIVTSGFKVCFPVRLSNAVSCFDEISVHAFLNFESDLWWKLFLR